MGGDVIWDLIFEVVGRYSNIDQIYYFKDCQIVDIFVRGNVKIAKQDYSGALLSPYNKSFMRFFSLFFLYTRSELFDCSNNSLMLSGVSWDFGLFLFFLLCIFVS